MRTLGFNRKDWMNYLTAKPKLEGYTFTTFRYPRRDKDWQLGEVVQIVIKPRTKQREMLGVAKIIIKQTKPLIEHPQCVPYPSISNLEAQADGFTCYNEMLKWLRKTHGPRVARETINKLTLGWVK